MTAPRSEQPIEFSEAAIEQLHQALRNFLSTWEETRHDTLRLSLERLCTEAHAAKLGPERMLIAVKAAWRRIPDLDRVDKARAEVAFTRVVNFCIDAYYADTSTSEPTSNPVPPTAG